MSEECKALCFSAGALDLYGRRAANHGRQRRRRAVRQAGAGADDGGGTDAGRGEVRSSIRLPAILFSLLSATYWFFVADLVGVASPLGGFGRQPYWAVALAAMLPPAVYAVASLYFCHWLARRIAVQAERTEGE